MKLEWGEGEEAERTLEEEGGAIGDMDAGGGGVLIGVVTLGVIVTPRCDGNEA